MEALETRFILHFSYLHPLRRGGGRCLRPQDPESVEGLETVESHPESQGSEDRHPGRHRLRLLHTEHRDGDRPPAVYVRCDRGPTI